MILIGFIEAIINEWDPVDLLFHAPDDEYLYEVEEIKCLLKSTKSHSELTQGIQNIFVKSRGNNFLKNTRFECAGIAKQILSQLMHG